MDTPISTESSSGGVDSAKGLNDAQATEMFGAILDKPEKPEKPAAPDAPQTGDAPAAPDAGDEPQGGPNEAAEGDDALYTVKIDGKDVQLTQAQIADAYKNGLKEKDYRQKTMALSDERKQAQAAAQQAEAQRNHYAMQVQQGAQQLATLVQLQDQTNWDQLLESDPVEFLKQRNLYNKRQTALNQHHQELANLQAQQAAMSQRQRADFVTNQRDNMLAKIPAWKDQAKAKAEMSQVAEYLKTEGYDEREINEVIDHRPVVMARKAMLYDQMMARATAAQKKVSNLPARTERPGVGDAPHIDRRTNAFQRLSKTGRDADAVALFNQIL